MMIQCTSVGLKNDDKLPLVDNEEFYDRADCAVDLIYNPDKTKFVRLMEGKNIKVINGLKMLLYQGILAYELWNNVLVPKELSDIVYKKLKEKIIEK